MSIADMGAAVQLMGIIRTLLDPENMLASVNKSEKTDFLNHFYKHCMHGELKRYHSGLKGETPEKKCLQQSVNGFFHQNIYWFWKALTQNPRVGSFSINPTKCCKKTLKIEF